MKMRTFRTVFDRFSNAVTSGAGSPAAFISAFVIILLWAVTGPIFHFSDTWQLVINTGTTIITFLMVFVIQQSQNKDTIAIHMKLNELIASNAHSSNRLIDAEDLTDDELKVIKEFYCQLAAMAKKEKTIFASHSLDEAKENALQKTQATILQTSKNLKK